METCGYVVLQRLQLRRAKAARLRRLGRIARRSNCQRHQVMDVPHEGSLQIKARDLLAIARDFQVVDQEFQRWRVTRDRAVAKVVHSRAQAERTGSGNAKGDDAARRLVNEAVDVRKRHQCGLAFCKHDLAIPVRDLEAAVQVDKQIDVVGGVGSDRGAAPRGTNAMHLFPASS